MQGQRPSDRQVGGRIQYDAIGAYRRREARRKKCALVIFTIIILLIGAILTIIGKNVCVMCEDTKLQRDLSNCFIAGTAFLLIGFLSLVITIRYFIKLRYKALQLAGGGNSCGETEPTTFTSYNPAGLRALNVRKPGTRRMQPSAPQQPYPTAPPTHPYPTAPPTHPYPTAPPTHPYPTAPPQQSPGGPQPSETAPPPYPGGSQAYPTAPQSYPTGSSQQYPPSQSGTPYPPAQQPYPGTAQNQDNMPPPPSYDEVVGGSGGRGGTMQ